MGEASRRKKADPLYGKVAQKDRFKGIIVSPPIEIEGTRLYAKSSSLDPMELRFSLFFWDTLVWPSSRAIHFASGEDELYLEREGKLIRPDYTFNGDGAQGIAQGQIKAFNDFEEQQPGAWTLGQGPNSLLVEHGNFDSTGGLELKLLQSIPLPKHDIPLDMILDFKERRHPELIILRNTIDQFRKRVEKAENQQQELEKCIYEIDLACSELLKVTLEYQLPVTISNFNISFNRDPINIFGEIAKGYVQGLLLGQTSAIANGLMSGIQSAVSINSNGIKLRSHKRPPTPFKYTYQIHRDLI